jgi:micrococcal nuclease
MRFTPFDKAAKVELAIISLLVLLIVSALAAGHRPPQAQPRQGPASGLVVVDGDTIRDAQGVSHRLLGYDTPETFRAKCAAELKLGKQAQARLGQLIASGEARLLQSGRRDKYGRSLSTLTVGGRDVREILISEGLARPYDGRTKRGGWC